MTRRLAPIVSLALLLTACTVPPGPGAKSPAAPLEGAYLGALTTDFPVPPKGGGDPRWVAAHATDGDPNSYWGSTPYLPAWIAVDLGAVKRVGRLQIQWERNTYPTDYDIEVSRDGRTWTPALEVRGWGGNSLDDRSFPVADARWVRIYGRKGDNPYGMWLSVLDVRGPDDPATDLARGRAVRSSGEAPLDITEAIRAQVFQAIAGGDARYKAGDHQGALDRWRQVYDPYAYSLKTNLGGYPKDQWTYEQLRLRVLAAEFRIRKPGVEPATTRQLVLLTVPLTDLDFPATALGPAKHITRRLDETNLGPWRDGWYWFAESFLALTDGQVGWAIREEPLDDAKVAKISVSEPRKDGYDVMAQLGTGDVEPPLVPRLAEHLDADMFAVLWPGTHDGFQTQVTNGGSGTASIPVAGGWTTRPFIISEGHATQPYIFYNTASYAHHEFFHQLEYAYAEQDFPKEPLHSFFDRSRWPDDFTGYGEWDFYENVFRRRIMKADAARRVEWASGRYPAGVTVRTLVPQKAVDGDRNTRWSSRFNDKEWIFVDLGKIRAVNRVAIAWENAYAKAYKVQAYNPKTKLWRTLRTVTSGDGGDDEVRFTAFSTRYVRVAATQRATPYGHSIYELGVYGPDAPDTNLALNRPAKASSVESDPLPGRQ